MSSSSQSWISASPIASALSSWILDTFEIDQQEYQVVRLAGQNQPRSIADIPHERLAQYTEISRFEVEGQLCAVVKIDKNHDSESNSDVADLTLLLTGRELQIATLVALGQANKQIARQLQISEWTVSTHLRRIFMKLGVDSRAAMVYRCAGLIQKLQGQLAPS